jgi:lipopolysaccharide transport system ATP-binding protein
MITVRAEGLGKKYQVGVARNSSTLFDAARLALSRTLNARAREEFRLRSEFWAVRDVSFELSNGEVLGIVGQNGSGKSTLLKMLARITKPSEGYFEMWGHVGALLEVGTGFHPDLTGRENVYLNGSILGMRRRDITNSFDSIVDFSGIEKFIDTPVKYYSSGMQVRLAFAVAAHLQSEMLLLDEVLAVGDIGFQQKSRERVKQMALDGRTVLFVSHDMSAVQELCTRAILLEKGSVVKEGTTAEIVSAFSELIFGAVPESTV